MADIAQLESALIKADAAGDADGARILASEIRRTRGSARSSAARQVSGDAISRGARAVEATPAELIAANPTVRVLTGAAKPVLGAAALVEGLWGGTSNKDRIKQLEEMQRKGNEALELGVSGTVADVVGAVASPITAGASKIAPAASYLGKVAQGAGIGAAAGVTAGGESPLADATLGASLGGAIPAVGIPVAKTVKGAYNALAEPLLNPAAIKGRAFLEAAGDKADEIIALLRQNKEIVPGSMPTAGEAAVPAGRAEFAALQRSASGVKPSAYLARSDEQNAARIAELRTVGQDKPALEGAIAARKTASDPLYKAARTGGNIVDAVPIVKEINKVLSQNPGNRELVNELVGIKKGLLSKGAARTDAGEVLSVVDGIKASMAKEDNKFILGQLDSIKKKITDAVPGYSAAQAKFAEKSVPVNQMQVGQYLEKKLVPALSDEAKQTAATFSGAVRDAPGTIKRATDGSARYEELSQILNPKQLAVVQSVQDDLARGARFDVMAQKGSKAAPNAVDLATQSMEQAVGGKVPNPLNRHVMVFNQILSRLEGKINKKLAAEVAVEMLNPPGVAESIKQASARESRNRAMAKAVQRYELPLTAVTVQTQQ